MKFVRLIKITIQYGPKLKSKVVMFANESELTGDEHDFKITGKFIPSKLEKKNDSTD